MLASIQRNFAGLFAGALLAVVSSLALTSAAHAQLVVMDETFSGTTMSSGWQVGTSSTTNTYVPQLTAATGDDTAGTGWLRLTTAQAQEATVAYNTNSFNGKDATIAVKFNYAAYGGNGADGITFFLARAPVAGETFSAGAYGGSLGYAQKNQAVDPNTDQTHVGMTGGYIGLGIDEFGNFSNPTEGRVGGEGFYKPNVSVRGPGEGQSGYEYLGGTGPLSTPISFTGGTRPTGDNQRTFEVTITATNQLTVYLQAGADAPMEALYSVDLSGYGRYDDLILGFTGSTGGQTNIHEIQGLSLASQKARLWTNASGTPGTWGTGGNWDGTPAQIPGLGADVLLDNRYVNSAQVIAMGGERSVRSVQIDAPFAYTLGTTVGEGTLRFSDNGILGPSGIFVSKGHGVGTHTINSAIIADNAITISNASSSALAIAGTVDTNGKVLTLSGSGTTNFTNSISGGGRLQKIEAGTAVLSGANTFSGGTLLRSGTLTVGHANALGTGDVGLRGGTLSSTTGSINVANTLALQGDAALSNIITSGVLTQTGGNRTLTMTNATHTNTVNLSDDATGRTLTVAVNSGSSTISGNIQDGVNGATAGSLTKTGGGTLVLGGNNSYKGTTTISNGTLALGNNNRLDDLSAVSIAASGVLNLNTFSEKVGTLTAEGGATLDFGTTGNANTFMFGTYVAPTSGVLVVKNWQSGVDSLATSVGTNNVSTVYFAGQGMAVLGPQTTIGSYGTGYLLTTGTQGWNTWLGGSTTWGNGGNWSLGSIPNASGALVNFTGNASSATVNLNGNRTITGMRFDSTAKAYTLTNGSGNRTLTMAGPIAFVQQQSSSNQIFSFGTLLLNTNTVFDFTPATTNQTLGNLQIDSLLDGPGNLIKDGAGNGKLILRGNNTGYDSSIFINSGTLQITNGGGLGTTVGSTAIADGGTLELNGAANFTTAEALSIAGQGVGSGGAIRNLAASNTLSGDIALATSSRINSDAGLLTLTGTISTPNNSSLYLGGAGNITVGGTAPFGRIAIGTGSVTIDGTGTVTFAGNGSTNTQANTYTGTTFVNSGTLVLDKASWVDAANGNRVVPTDAISGSLIIGDSTGAANSAVVRLNRVDQIDDLSDVTINSDGLFDVNGKTETIGALSGNGAVNSATAATLRVGDANSSTFSGTISGASLTLIKQSGGKLTLTGANSYGGGTTIASGIIAIQNNQSLGTGGVLISSGGNLELTGGLNNVAYNFNLNGPGTLSKDGAIQSTAGINTLTGTLTLQSSSWLAADAGSTLNVNNSITGGASKLTLGGGGTIVVAGALSGSGSAVVGDTGSLDKVGDGTAILSGNNTYTGATNVKEGTLQIQHNNALGTAAGGVTVSSGATLALSHATGLTVAESPLSINGDGMTGTGALRNVGGTNSMSGAITLAGPTTVVVAGGSLALSGAIAGAAANSLTTIGPGTLTLSGTTANTFAGSFNVNSGTVILGKSDNVDAAGNGTGALTIGTGLGGPNAATVQLNGNQQIANGQAVVVQSDGRLDVNGRTETIGSLAGSGNLALGAGTLTVSNAANVNTQFTGAASGSGTLAKTGAGTLTLGGTVANSFATGKISIAQGTVSLGAANAIGNSTQLELNGGTFAVAGTFSDTIGSLALLSNSTIDFLGNTSSLTFTNVARTGGTLTITNWSGNPFGAGNSQLIFSNAATGFTGGTVLNEISFANYGTGAVRLASGEIVPNTGAGIFVWALATGGNWDAAANWSPNGTPTVVGSTAILSNGTGTPSTISLNGANRTLGYLTIDSTKGYTVTGNGTNSLVFDVNGGSAQIINNNSGSSTIDAAIKLNDAIGITQNGTGNLILNGAISNFDANARNITVTVNDADANPATGTIALNGAIQTGTGSLTKNGGGVLTLGGTNTFSGGTVINGGTVKVATDANLGANTGALTLNGGTLENSASFILSATRAVAVNSSGGTFQTDGASILTYAGNLTGTGAIIKTGTGTFVTGGAGANTQSGALTINAGVFEVAKTVANGAIGNTSAVTVASTSTLRFNGTGANNAETIGSLAGAGTVDNISTVALGLTTGGDNSSTLFSGVIQNSGAGAGALSLTKTGTGTMTLSGANTFSGTTTVSQGVLNIQHSSGLGATTAGTSVAAGAALQLQGGIAVGAEALTLNGTGVAADGALRNISGNNSFAGNITLGSTVEISSDAGALTLGGTIQGNGTARALGFDGAGNVTVTGVIGSATAGNNVTTLTKDGIGRLTLTNANLFSAGTTINAGTLEIQNGAALGATGTGAGTTVAAGGTLAVSNNISTGETPLTLNGAGDGSGGALRSLSGGNTVSGAVTLGSSALVGVDTGTLTMSGVVSGAFELTKVGAGTLVLSNNNTYSGGTTVSAGTVQINTDSATGGAASRLGTVPTGATAGNITLNGGALSATATMTLNANRGVALGSAGGTLDVLNTGTTMTYAGVVAGTGSLTKTGAGTLVLSGTNTYSGGTVFNGGTVSINADARLGAVPGSAQTNLTFNGGTLATNFNGALDANRSIVVQGTGSKLDVAAGTSLSFGGTITGPGELTLALGAGTTFTLGSDINFSGGTLNLAGGTLALGGIDLSIGTFHITGSTTLDFTGASKLTATNFIVDAGAIVNVINWTDTSDLFLADHWWTNMGMSTEVPYYARGSAPESQVRFNGGTGSTTSWVPYDATLAQVTPVPEPRTYGAIFLAICGALLGWRRWRQRTVTQ